MVIHPGHGPPLLLLLLLLLLMLPLFLKLLFYEEHGFNEVTNITDTTYKAGSLVGEGRRAPALPRRPQPT